MVSMVGEECECIGAGWWVGVRPSLYVGWRVAGCCAETQPRVVLVCRFYIKFTDAARTDIGFKGTTIAGLANK